MPWFENFPIKYIKFELLIKNKDKIIIDKFFDVKKRVIFTSVVKKKGGKVQNDCAYLEYKFANFY